MGIGIDWVSVVILAAAWVFSMIRSVPVRFRHWGFAAACFVIAAWRLRMGAAGVNLIFVGIAVALGISYTVQGLRAPKR
ncbi:MAG: hypothetical protein IT380_09000 [Myxococcales bacterium]|nr:hypothetical protein [Myxococcales bacterium]